MSVSVSFLHLVRPAARSVLENLLHKRELRRRRDTTPCPLPPLQERRRALVGAPSGKQAHGARLGPLGRVSEADWNPPPKPNGSRHSLSVSTRPRLPLEPDPDLRSD